MRHQLGSEDSSAYAINKFLELLVARDKVCLRIDLLELSMQISNTFG